LLDVSIANMPTFVLFTDELMRAFTAFQAWVAEGLGYAIGLT
jgi:hypothetical protein